MRYIFLYEKRVLLDAVKHFKVGRTDGTDFDGCNHILFTIFAENYSKRRKVASGETDFVQLLLLDIIPALHCYYLLGRSREFINLETDLPTKAMKDNLFWVLFFMVQYARKHGGPWYSDVRTKQEQTIKIPRDLLSSKRWDASLKTFHRILQASITIYREKSGTFISRMTAPYTSSCTPNAKLVNTGKGMFLVAISFIPSGGHITLDLYDSLSKDPKTRRAHLKATLGSVCK